MRDFIKKLPYKHALPLYVIFFLILTIIGKYCGFEWYGIKFSLSITFISLIIDLLLVYRIYKKSYKKY